MGKIEREDEISEDILGEIDTFVDSFVQLTVAGIQSGKEPKEVMNYFFSLIKEFEKNMDKIKELMEEK